MEGTLAPVGNRIILPVHKPHGSNRASTSTYQPPTSTQDISTSDSQPIASPRCPSQHEPPQVLKVVRLPFRADSPKLMIEVVTIDVRAENHTEDDGMFNVPDFRRYWDVGIFGYWKYRRAFRVLNESKEDSPVLQGYYVVFTTFGNWATHDNAHFPWRKNDCRADFNIREDAFVAKLADKPTDSHGWAAYVDMPEEFLLSDLWKGRMGRRVLKMAHCDRR